MITGSRTSCRSVCAIHAMMMIRLPLRSAEGRLISARSVNR